MVFIDAISELLCVYVFLSLFFESLNDRVSFLCLYLGKINLNGFRATEFRATSRQLNIMLSWSSEWIPSDGNWKSNIIIKSAYLLKQVLFLAVKNLNFDLFRRQCAIDFANFKHNNIRWKVLRSLNLYSHYKNFASSRRFLQSAPSNTGWTRLGRRLWAPPAIIAITLPAGGAEAVGSSCGTWSRIRRRLGGRRTWESARSSALWCIG